MLFFNFSSLTSAAVTNDGQLMCAGFEDSAVRLWSLTEKKLVVNRRSWRQLSDVNLSTGTHYAKVAHKNILNI